LPEPLRVLYLEGDAAAPKYVRAALSTDAFRLIEPAADTDAVPSFDVAILSDLPYARLGRAREEALIERLMDGAGLLMVGGWNSFGRGLYANSQLAEHLPVRIESSDDRINLAGGAVVRPAASHPLIEGFSFDPPPMIAGFNRLHPRRGAQTLLEAWRVAGVQPDGLRLAATADPLLMASETTGRVLALATDLAPHWSGGWTDWGDRMLRFADHTEIGNDYVAFLQRLVLWSGRRDLPLAALGASLVQMT
jgi:uncharacterized membrane protein